MAPQPVEVCTAVLMAAQCTVGVCLTAAQPTVTTVPAVATAPARTPVIPACHPRWTPMPCRPPLTPLPLLPPPHCHTLPRGFTRHTTQCPHLTTTTTRPQHPPNTPSPHSTPPPPRPSSRRCMSPTTWTSPPLPDSLSSSSTSRAARTVPRHPQPGHARWEGMQPSTRHTVCHWAPHPQMTMT